MYARIPSQAYLALGARLIGVSSCSPLLTSLNLKSLKQPETLVVVVVGATDAALGVLFADLGNEDAWGDLQLA
ncbi:MAG: hypothetical protein ABL949_12420 [Fimbriimonadaceae bacterium]